MHANSTPIQGTSRPKGKKPCRILCVDDQRWINEILQCALEQAGHVVECATDGQEALERINADVAYFDLLITDHQMPRLNGLALVTRLRGTPFRGKIVVHSSALSPSDITAYRLLAVDQILAKPANLPTLLGCAELPASD